MSLVFYECRSQNLSSRVGGVLGSIFAGYVPLASQNTYPIYMVYYVAILVTFDRESSYF